MEFRMPLCQPPAQSRRVRPDCSGVRPNCWRLWASPVGVNSPTPRMESHSLWVICSSAWLPSRGKFQRSEPLLLQLMPRVSHLPTRHSSGESGSLCPWQPPHGHWWGLLLSPPKAFPSPDWTSPAPSAPLQGHAPAFTISVSLNCTHSSVPISCVGGAKIHNTSQAHEIISVSIFPTVEEQLMRRQSETFIRQIRSQLEYHRSWFLVEWFPFIPILMFLFQFLDSQFPTRQTCMITSVQIAVYQWYCKCAFSFFFPLTCTSVCWSKCKSCSASTNLENGKYSNGQTTLLCFQMNWGLIGPLSCCQNSLFSTLMVAWPYRWWRAEGKKIDLSKIYLIRTTWGC